MTNHNSEPSFQVGDWIECVNDTQAWPEELKKGQRYKIRLLDGPDLISLEGYDAAWNRRRFKKVDHRPRQLRQLRAVFLDRHATLVETVFGTPEEVAEKVAEFIRANTHGAVEFAPYAEPEAGRRVRSKAMRGTVHSADDEVVVLKTPSGFRVVTREEYVTDFEEVVE